MAIDSERIVANLDRPILTHLNADTAWLISFPRPPTTKSQLEAAQTKRSFYHIVVDPWLDGEYVVGFRWFMAMQHTEKSSYRTIQSIRELILKIERAAGNSPTKDNGEVDAIIVSHYLGDHFHRGTLEQIDPSVPIISISAVVKEVKNWHHFHTMEVMPDLDVNAPQSLWQERVPSALPDYIRVGRLPDGGSYPELHWATLIAFSSSDAGLTSPNSNVETIVYSPHGIYSDRFSNLEWANQQSRPLALLHGLSPAFSPQAANLGVENGAKLAKILKPKYWIPTHDEELEYWGILGWFQRKPRKTFDDAVFEDEGTMTVGKPICKELENGEVFVLV